MYRLHLCGPQYHHEDANHLGLQSSHLFLAAHLYSQEKGRSLGQKRTSSLSITPASNAADM